MCNLYSQTKGQAAIVAVTKAMRDLTGNLPPLPGIWPDTRAPIVRAGADGVRELAMARWGLPTPPQHLTTRRDPGVTNVRNTASPHWRGWLGPAHRCLVPLTAFAEPRSTAGRGSGNVWFGPAEAGQQMFFAGLHVPNWRSIRKVKDGETVDDLYAFLTTAPNAEVAAVHPKAMPVILTDPQDCEDWLTLPWPDARQLQRPLPDHSLVEVDDPTLIEADEPPVVLPNPPAQGSLF
ncbi:SOS response-associated peptidase [Paracoccus suum]|uniref:Abasic site processing protein n=1 Tax=Paracoccus suum TaxID=2259340 RepID=A0A344PJD7_9RHOB|nr:SOS response-associated peptidase family protein [Paracoccus suum]AXC49492.1 SOS response-associated peptidase [Paracoccus suum]